MKRKDREKCLNKLIEYMSKASTRTEAYARVAKEFGTSIAAIRMMASRAHLTSKAHSMRCSFTIEEEDSIVQICIKYARRGEPLTIPDFIELVSRYKKKPKNKKFSRKFVTSFCKRHKDVLCVKPGKTTSPTRSSDVMQQYTEGFIDELDTLIRSNIINNNNLFVFDETVIGDPDVKQLFIGERRKSGGGNINVFKRRASALGAYIPFSMCNGSTPFKVFVRRVSNLSNRSRSRHRSEENVKVVRSANQYRLHLTSSSGYINLALFRCIMEHFTK